MYSMEDLGQSNKLYLLLFEAELKPKFFFSIRLTNLYRKYVYQMMPLILVSLKNLYSFYDLFKLFVSSN